MFLKQIFYLFWHLHDTDFLHFGLWVIYNLPTDHFVQGRISIVAFNRSEWLSTCMTCAREPVYVGMTRENMIENQTELMKPYFSFRSLISCSYFIKFTNVAQLNRFQFVRGFIYICLTYIRPEHIRASGRGCI